MASHSLPRARRTASSPLGSGAKAGPLPGPIKATQVFNLTTMASAGSQATDGHILLKTKRSSSDRLHSGSPVRERKTMSDGAGITIHKSRSVDAVTSNCYLNGEWPRADPLVAQAYFCPSNLTLDRATQTPQEWCHLRSSKSSKSEMSGRPANITSADSLKSIRACLTRSNRESGRHTSSGQLQTNSTVTSQHRYNAIGLALLSKPLAVPEMHKVRATVHGSPDNLSQEIEKLAMTVNASFSDEIKPIPDGRCAPVAEHLKMCSAVTQTPLQFTVTKETSAEGDGLPLAPDAEYASRDDFYLKGTGSPELVRFASPQALQDRLAPEGCEKICGIFQEMKIVDDLIAEVSTPLKVPSNICHIPSESSAFNPPLVKNYLNQPTRMAKKMNSVGINN